MATEWICQDETAPRNERGAFIGRQCTDPHCDGTLAWDGSDWTCDGLTYGRDDGPLVACDYSAPSFKRTAP